MKKRILSVLLAAILFSTLIVQSFAATTIYLPKGGRETGGQCYVTRTNKSTAYVQCVGQQMCKITLVLRTNTNAWLWEGPIGGSWQRTLSLGTDHSQYRISGKYIGGSAPTAGLGFFAKGNCTIK